KRIYRLQQYTSFDTSIKVKKEGVDHKTFISHQDYSPKIFFNNLDFNSDVFRHSLRLSLAVLAGYLVGLFFNLGHSYWIMMTTIIILKPAYSLTKERNKDRLEGTIVGIFFCVIILLLVKNTMALLILLVIFMMISNILIRTLYFWSVMFMTAYVLIFFTFLYPENFTAVMFDRLIDTMIGSGIAFISSFFLLPSWEHQKIKHLLLQMLDKNREYFKTVANAPEFHDQSDLTTLVKARKNAFVALSNLTGAFNRMLSEPKNRQHGLQQIHQFIVVNHIIISHIAYLTHQLTDYRYQLKREVLKNLVLDIERNFDIAKVRLSNENFEGETPNPKRSLKLLNQQAEELMEKRKKELEAG